MRRVAAAVLGLGLLAGCGGEPIVARSPEALLRLAQEQCANRNYRAASDTLGRVLEQAPPGELAGRAHLFRLVLLGGMARGYQEMAEGYLEGARQAAPAATELRTVAMDYFGRARGRSIEMVEAFDRFLREPRSAPLRLDLPLPDVPGGESGVLAKIRSGSRVAEEDQRAAEEEKIRQGLAVLMAEVLGAGEDVRAARARTLGEATLEPDAVSLALAREMIEASRIYRKDALNDPRLLQLYYERAQAVAEGVAQRARERGEPRLQKEAEELARKCQGALASL